MLLHDVGAERRVDLGAALGGEHSGLRSRHRQGFDTESLPQWRRFKGRREKKIYCGISVSTPRECAHAVQRGPENGLLARGQPITLAYVSGIYATPRVMRRIVASQASRSRFSAPSRRAR